MLVRTLLSAFLLSAVVKASAEPIRCVGHTGMVESVAFSPDSKTVASGGGDRMVRVWDAANGKQLLELPIYGPVTSVAISPDGKIVAVGAGRVPVTFWELATGKKLDESLPASRGTQTVTFSPDGSKLAVVGRGPIYIWDLNTKKVVFDLPRFSGTKKVVFSPDGTLLAADSGDIWNWATGEQIFKNQWLSPKPGTWWIPGQSIAFSPDGKYIVGAGDGFVEWDWSERKQALREPDGKFFCVAVSPNGKTIATGGADAQVRLWDFETGRLTGLFKGHTDQIVSLSFSPDGEKLASASLDKSVLIWTLDTDVTEPDAK